MTKLYDEGINFPSNPTERPAMSVDAGGQLNIIKFKRGGNCNY
jgi:hypothetical protein